MFTALLSQVRHRARRFARAEGGNIAIIFALATLPLAGFAGAAIDYSRANAVKAALQTALDSTALMLSKEATTDTSSQLQTNATKYFNANFSSEGIKASSVTVTPVYSSSTPSQITVNGTVNVPTNFVGLLGVKYITLNESSTAAWGSTRLRVALVLDNTGSMADAGKITALKSATKNLLAMLKSAAGTNGDVYVSIIPFSKDVNVGPCGSNCTNETWIDWDDWDAANGSWQNTTSCSGTSKRGRSRCSSTQTWVPAAHTTWNGCITDRDQSYDQTITAANPADASLPAGQASTLFPAEQYGQCPLAMMGLSYDWTSMNSLVDQMYPNGNTNQPIGLVWGWQSLVGGGPLTAPAMDSNYKYQQIIILLSDGLNTADRWYQAQTPVDNRMVQTGNGSGTCANIKAAGITIYTIQVNTGGDPTSTLLQSCASDTSKFWMLTSASQINTTFNTIGTNLTQLRVAK
jgi:Flp pilus assembly protein TadG